LHALENDLIREATTVQERGELPDGEPEPEPKGKLKRRIYATAPVIDLDHLDLDHLGFARSAVSQAHIGATAWGLDIDETQA